MKITKQARRDGKSLFRTCFVNGQFSEDRARDLVTRVLAAKPRGYLPALSHFQRLLHLYLQSRQAHIENAVETSPDLRRSIEASLAQRYGPGLEVTHSVNPALLGGLRIRVGSDVYDGSVQARLEQFAEQF
jgi:F-type H+-transporting ATPase subunit delta